MENSDDLKNKAWKAVSDEIIRQNQEDTKWYEKTWVIAVLCVFFFPVGLFLLWKNNNISMGRKIGVTAIFAIIILSKLL